MFPPNQKGVVAPIIFLLFLVAAIVLTVYLAGTHQGLKSDASNKSQAGEIQKLTTDLLNSSKNKKNPSQLSTIAMQRKRLMLEEAQNYPASFASLAFSESSLKKIPESVRQYIEQNQSLQGDLVVFENENFKTDQPDQAPYLSYKLKITTTEKNKKSAIKYINLNFIDKQAPQTQSSVTVQAVVLDDQAVVKSIVGSPVKKSQAKTSSGATISALTSGDRKVLVLLSNFVDNNNQPVTPEQVKTLMFDGSVSVNNFYKENSYGSMSFSGDVSNWMTLPTSGSNCNNYTSWMSLANGQAALAGYNLSSYQHVVYVWSVNGCLMTGVGQQGSAVTPATANIFGFYDAPSVYAHELGHNLGATHADVVSCFSGIAKFPSCFFNRYGESPATVMGNPISVLPNMFHFNAPTKLQTGLLPQNRYQEISTDGTYEIVPLESTSGVAAMRIGRRLKTFTYYYLSYRQPMGFDSGLGTNITSGLNIHIIDPTQTNGNTVLVDLDPNNNIVDGALVDGQVFYDWANGVSIKQLSHDSSKATFQVALTTPLTSPPPSPTPTPTSTPSPSPSPSPSLDPNLDSDVDGFKDVVEISIGTIPTRFCPQSSLDDAWPPDTNNDGVVNGGDISKIIPFMEQNRPTSGQAFKARYDLNQDQKIDSADVAVIQQYFLQSCQ